MSIEQWTCVAYFLATTNRDKNGRFVVALPKEPEVLNRLRKSYVMAKSRRLITLSRRAVSKQIPRCRPHTRHSSANICFRDMLCTSRFCFLPHHCSVRPDSLTTNLGVVFDASSTTDTEVFLNDALIAGPVVHEDLVCITMRFRLQKFANTSDIEKKYLQVLVMPSDRPLQQMVGVKSNRAICFS